MKTSLIFFVCILFVLLDNRINTMEKNDHIAVTINSKKPNKLRRRKITNCSIQGAMICSSAVMFGAGLQLISMCKATQEQEQDRALPSYNSPTIILKALSAACLFGGSATLCCAACESCFPTDHVHEKYE